MLIIEPLFVALCDFAFAFAFCARTKSIFAGHPHTCAITLNVVLHRIQSDLRLAAAAVFCEFVCLGRSSAITVIIIILLFTD